MYGPSLRLVNAGITQLFRQTEKIGSVLYGYSIPTEAESCHKHFVLSQLRILKLVHYYTYRLLAPVMTSPTLTILRIRLIEGESDAIGSIMGSAIGLV